MSRAPPPLHSGLEWISASRWSTLTRPSRLAQDHSSMSWVPPRASSTRPSSRADVSQQQGLVQSSGLAILRLAPRRTSPPIQCHPARPGGSPPGGPMSAVELGEIRLQLGKTASATSSRAEQPELVLGVADRGFRRLLEQSMITDHRAAAACSRRTRPRIAPQEASTPKIVRPEFRGTGRRRRSRHGPLAPDAHRGSRALSGCAHVTEQEPDGESAQRSGA